MTEQQLTICRLCLATCDNLNFISTSQTDMLQIVLPSMDVNISQFVMICNGCATILEQMFTFKSTLLQNEDNLYHFTNGGQKQAHLEDILGMNAPAPKYENKMKTVRVCRTCLGYLGHNLFTDLSESDNHFLMDLQVYLPEMDTKLTKKPVVCPACIDTLKYMLSFIKLCMDNEKKIKQYLKILMNMKPNLCNVMQEPQNGGKSDRTMSNNTEVFANVVVKQNNNATERSIGKNYKRDMFNMSLLHQETVSEFKEHTSSSSSNHDGKIDIRGGLLEAVRIKPCPGTDLNPNITYGPTDKDIIVISDDETSSKKYNTRESNSKVANKMKTDEADDIVQDPDYEIDTDYSDYEEMDTDSSDCEMDSFEYGSASDEVKVQETGVKKSKKNETNKRPVGKTNVHDIPPRCQPSPISSNRKPFIYCKYCYFKAPDNITLEVHKLNCQISPCRRETAIMTDKGQTRRRKVFEEVHVNVVEQRDTNIAKNTRRLPRTTIKEVDVEPVTSDKENSVTLMVQNGRITVANGTEEVRISEESNKSVISSERSDSVIWSKSDTYMTGLLAAPQFQNNFVEITILKCDLCGFNSRSASKIKDHLISHCFSSYFAQYNVDGYRKIFYCGKCIRPFHDKFSLQDHDCVNNTIDTVAQFKIGVVLYCMRCPFETEEEDIFLSHIDHCPDQ